MPLQHSYNHSYPVHNIPTVSFALLADLALKIYFQFILYVDLVTEYNHGEMMWQPNTPTTPGKDFYPLIKIKFSQLFNAFAVVFWGESVF